MKQLDASFFFIVVHRMQFLISLMNWLSIIALVLYVLRLRGLTNFAAIINPKHVMKSRFIIHLLTVFQELASVPDDEQR